MLSYVLSSIQCYIQDDASFVDVFHTSSKFGIWDEALGDVDVWPNGGKDQEKGIYPNGHKAAVYFFSRTIVEPKGCQYLAWKCNDEFTSYTWENRVENDNCGYGDQTKVKINCNRFSNSLKA